MARARGEPVWQQPGPKPVGELDLAGNITAGDGSTVLGTYTTARWYHVEIGYERIGTDLRLTYWMDGSSVGQATISVGDLAVELLLDHVELDAQEGSAWFDNLRVYTFAAVLPIPVTLPATIITAGNAILNGDVNPKGLSATTCFEWGATTGYGAWTATQPADQGRTNVAVWSLLGTLSPSTSNHYRLMTSNSVGVCYGEDRAFTTLSLYEAWRQSQFTAAELSDAAISGDTANPDGDGKTNWHEFLACTTPNPTSATGRGFQFFLGVE